MTTIANLSDLHFGTEQREIADVLARDLCSAPPSVVVVSGDLTQRARRRQFQQAQAFLSELPQPQVVVPGNHDVPLYDVARRFLAPLARYRHFITPQLAPVVHQNGLLVAGINTARSLTWKEGRISPEQITQLRASLSARAARHRVVVTHHPFIPPPSDEDDRIKLVGRAAQALVVLDEQKVDLLLAGHLHHGYSGVTQPYYPTARRAIVAVQAGTAISRRTREQRNAYNWIRLTDDRVEVEIRTWNGTRFEPTAVAPFQRTNDTWAPG